MSLIDRSAQEQDFLNLAAQNRARAVFAREACPVPNCQGCHGWARTEELRALAPVYTARVSTLRTQYGWIIKRTGDKKKFGLYHFIEQKGVQQDLATGKELRHIGDLPVGIGGAAVEFYEVGR